MADPRACAETTGATRQTLHRLGVMLGWMSPNTLLFFITFLWVLVFTFPVKQTNIMMPFCRQTFALLERQIVTEPQNLQMAGFLTESHFEEGGDTLGMMSQVRGEASLLSRMPSFVTTPAYFILMAAAL